MQRHSMLFRAAAAAAMLTFAAAQTASACTGIMLRNADGSIVHGRTVEFGIPLASTTQSCRAATTSPA